MYIQPTKALTDVQRAAEVEGHPRQHTPNFMHNQTTKETTTMKTTQQPSTPNPISTLARRLLPSIRPERETPPIPHIPAQPPVIQRANRATASDYDRLHQTAGIGGDWAKSVYGDYYATSVSVYSAIKLRADAMARAPLTVLRPAPRATPPLEQAVSPLAPITPSSNSSTASTLGSPAATSGAPPRSTSASGAPPSGP